MKTFLSARFFAALSLLALGSSLHAETVPGTANLWLAGQANGTGGRITDVAPAQSPLLSAIVLTPGQDVTFDVTGGTNNAAGASTTGPDGSGTSVTHFNEFGIADMTAPLNSLVGVFLDASTPAEPYPSQLLNFSVAGNRDYAVLTPGLGQPFFIGDGRTMGAAVQHVRIPPGATRLYLGSMDTDNNNNNTGSFTVTVNVVAPAAITLPTPDFSLDSDTATVLPYYAVNEWTFRTRLAPSPTLPADAVVKVQASETPAVPGSWVDVTDGAMDNNGEAPGIGTSQTWLATTSQVPSGAAVFFRIKLVTPNDGEAVSTARGPFDIPGPQFMFPADVLGIYPEKNQGHTIGRTRQVWNFQAFQQELSDGSLPGLSLRVQASQTPAVEASWADLANGAVMKKGKKPFYWTLDTLIDLPAGTNYWFRTVSSAPGRLDSASIPFGPIDPYTILDPGVFQFDRTGLYINENLNSVVVRVDRLGGSYDKVKVKIATADGTAVAGKDYGKVSQTLTFLEGETSKTVTIPILNDTLIEDAETFKVVLSKPTNGSGLSSSRTVATVKIFDDETGGTPIPAFAEFSVSGPVGARNGEPWKFLARIPATTPGLFLHVQSTLTPLVASSWTDLPGGGSMKKKGDLFTLETSTLRVGANSFRVIASAPGYQERISAEITATVNPPLPPQEPTLFGNFITPVVNQAIRSGDPFTVSMSVSDSNGLQQVQLEYSTNGKSFKDYPGGTMTLDTGSIYKKTGVFFTGSGEVFLRVRALDGATPNVKAFSPDIALRFGLGGGTTGPTFGAFTTDPTPGPFVSGSNLDVFLPVSDDKEVKRVRLYSSDSAGNLLVEAGLMGKGKNAYGYRFNGLRVGRFYFRAIAEDFDGNAVTSGNFGPFDVETPLLPVYLNVAQDTRHVPPGAGHKKDGNDKRMPDQVDGSVTVEFNGVEAPMEVDYFPVDEATGQVVRMTDSNYLPVRVWATAGALKTTQGAATFPAPIEPGLYELRLRKKTREVPITAGGEIRFRVGQPFNYHRTFKISNPAAEPDYGIYWFRAENDGLKAIKGGRQNDDYFNQSRPTVVYVHGWQQRATAARSREHWQFTAPADGSIWFLCKIWRDRGYNVGIFYWNPFADDIDEYQKNGTLKEDSDIVPYRAEAKIYGSTGELNNQAEGQGMSFRYLSEKGSVVNVWSPSLYAGVTVADLFRTAWIEAFQDYVPNKNTKELRLVGHSLGTQLSGRAMYLLNIYPVNGVPLPTRLALLEVAQTDSGSLPGVDPGGTPHAGFPPRSWQLEYLKHLASAGVAIECYRTTDLQNLLGIRGAITFSSADTAAIQELCAFSRLKAEQLYPTDIRDFGKSKANTTALHAEAIRWYFASRDYNPPPVYSYPFLGNVTDTGEKAINATTSWTGIRNRMQGRTDGAFKYEQTEGLNTLDVWDDAFRKDSR